LRKQTKHTHPVWTRDYAQIVRNHWFRPDRQLNERTRYSHSHVRRDEHSSHVLGYLVANANANAPIEALSRDVDKAVAASNWVYLASANA
jgi:hypothetical protein